MRFSVHWLGLVNAYFLKQNRFRVWFCVFFCFGFGLFLKIECSTWNKLMYFAKLHAFLNFLKEGKFLEILKMWDAFLWAAVWALLLRVQFRVVFKRGAFVFGICVRFFWGVKKKVSVWGMNFYFLYV